MKKVFFVGCLFGIVAFAKVFVFVETDIGQYMDDTWGLATLLSGYGPESEYEIKAIVVSSNDTQKRAQIVGKLLARSMNERAQAIPILMDTRQSTYAGPQAHWARDFDLGTHPGGVFDDAVEVLGKMVAGSGDSTLYFVELGPPLVFSAVAAKFPEVLEKRGRASMMGGSFYSGYGRPGQVSEYNIKFNVSASQAFVSAKLSSPMVLSPLDTAYFNVSGDCYKEILEASESIPLLGGVIESYVSWKEQCPHDPFGLMCTEGDPQVTTGVVFDAEATTLALAEISTLFSDFDKALEFSTLGVSVDSKGYTNQDTATGTPARVALKWRDRAVFDSAFTKLLLQKTQRK